MKDRLCRIKSMPAST